MATGIANNAACWTLGIAVLVAACTRTGVNGPVADCGRGASFEYCIYAPEKPSGTVVYFLHYAGGSARSWSSWPTSRAFYSAFKDAGLEAPTVVSISFGRLWLLTEKGAGSMTGLLERFVADAIPFIELRTGRPARRLLWGVSMGGFNAAQLAMKWGDLWDAALLSCPAIPTLGPDPGPEAIEKYIKHTGATRQQVMKLGRLVRPYFPDDASWRKHDPIAIASTARGMPPITIECGDEDEYGFFDGSRRLANALRQVGHPVRFEVVSGGKHCAVASERTLPFLVAAALSGTSMQAAKIVPQRSVPKPVTRLPTSGPEPG